MYSFVVGEGNEHFNISQDAMLIHTLNKCFVGDRAGKSNRMNQHVNLIHMLNVLICRVKVLVKFQNVQL